MEGCSIGSGDTKHGQRDEEGNKAYEPEPFERARRGLVAGVDLHVEQLRISQKAQISSGVKMNQLVVTAIT